MSLNMIQGAIDKLHLQKIVELKTEPFHGRTNYNIILRLTGEKLLSSTGPDMLVVHLQCFALGVRVGKTLAPNPLIKVGTEEGDLCNRDGCPGFLEFDVRGCSCHLMAPCGSCESTPLSCPVCGYEEE